MFEAVPKNRQRLGYRRIVQLLVYLVIVPTALILLVGIVLMFLGSTFHLLFGALTVSFVLVAVTGIVLVLVFLRREANRPPRTSASTGSGARRSGWCRSSSGCSTGVAWKRDASSSSSSPRRRR